MFDKNLQESLSSCALLVQGRMDELLSENFHDSRLIDAMRYSSLSDGKRIRPFLTLVTADIFGIKLLDALDAAVAIEFIHCYSLIHDDLPAMDDDDLRRGKPTCHKKFDEATAVLAGDALLTYAFEILSSSSTHIDSNVRCELIKVLAKASGQNGMVGGQMIDLEKANKKISKEEMAAIHRLKTGELFMASAEFGAILGRASVKERNALRYYAHDLGLAFQIKDDILDHTQDSSPKVEIDEIVHKKEQENTSIVNIVGVDQAKKQLEMLKEQSLAHIKTFGNKVRLLEELTDFVVTRKK